MKIRVTLTLSLFIVLLCFRQAEGQGFTTKGTDFWLGFMENYLGDDTTHSDRMKVYITTDFLPASGTISVPLGGWSQNFNVPPNSTLAIIIPTDIVMCTETDAIENKGVHVISDNPVSVYQLNYVKYTSDANINIPTTSLGKRYRVTTYSPASASMAWTEVSISELLVVAAYDGTVIRIVPKCNTMGGHGANVPFIVTLNQGQVYQIKSYPSSAYSLTGSLIELDTTAADNCKTFAVFSGNQCAFVPGDSCCCNHICEQMMPINSWGKQYVTVPLKTRASDVFRIVGQQSGTIFTINGGPPHGLNAGGFYEEVISGASFIDSNHPVSVAQFSKSAATDGNENSDPFMIMINPLAQTIRRIVFNSFVTPIISSYFVNIITKTAYTNLVILDGTNISSSFLPVASNPLYSYAQVSVTQGNHILSSDSGLIANVYGYGWYETFGYIAGATVKNLSISYSIITPTDTLQYYDLVDTLCRSLPLTFAASFNPFIIDYSWNFGDGTPVIHGQTVTHTYNAAGNYIVKYYYERNGICGMDSIVWPINIKCCNDPPDITAPSLVCTGTTATIEDVSTFNPNATYNWSFAGGNILSGSGQGPYQVSWNDPGTRTLWVYVSEPSCSTDSTFISLNVNSIPTSTFTVVSPLCPGESSTINYTGNGSPDANYLWDFAGGIISSGNGPGPYSVSWVLNGIHNIKLTVSENGCSSSVVVPVSIFQPSIALFTANPQTTFIEQPLIQFNDNSINTSIWSWNFGDTSSVDNYSTLQSPSHNYYNQGTFRVWLMTISPEGCIDSVSLDVHVIKYNAFYIPNAFTPNGNGLNDIFQPYSTDWTYTLYIFSRWGEQLFTGRNQGWDGTFKGETVQQDIYAWLLIYSFKNEYEKRAYGRVTVLR